MSLPPLQQFREMVFRDPALQEQLDSLMDPAAFAGLASEIARGRGIELSPAEILAAFSAARQQWILRSLP